jgi:hypothetical protein
VFGDGWIYNGDVFGDGKLNFKDCVENSSTYGISCGVPPMNSPLIIPTMHHGCPYQSYPYETLDDDSDHGEDPQFTIFEQFPMENREIASAAVANHNQNFPQFPMGDGKVASAAIANHNQNFPQFPMDDGKVASVAVANHNQNFPQFPIVNQLGNFTPAVNDQRKKDIKLCAYPECVETLKRFSELRGQPKSYCSERCRNRTHDLKNSRRAPNRYAEVLHKQAFALLNNASVSYDEFMKSREKLAEQMQQCQEYAPRMKSHHKSHHKSKSK